MQKITFYFILLFSCSLFSQNVSIPDANFKAALLEQFDLDTNNDGEIQVSEASSYMDFIDVSNRDITDLTGIEAFTGIMDLNCSYNSISNLTLDGLNDLTGLNCSYNTVPLALSVTNCAYLIDLSISNSNITSLDISGNTNLNMLDCGSNSLTELDLNGLPISMLTCSNNQFTSLDFSAVTTLIMLDFSNNTVLEFVNLKNGNNENVFSPAGFNCPSLTSICVDSVTYAEDNWALDLDPSVTFTDECSASDPIVIITDVNFKAALLAHTPVINTNGDQEIQVSEAEAFIAELNVSNQGISNLTGLESFVNITNLNISNNNLAVVSLAANTNLQVLNMEGNQITEVNFEINPALVALYASNNNIEFATLLYNANLEILDLSNNNLQTLNLENNINLYHVNTSGNLLLEYVLFKNGANTNILDNANGFQDFTNCPALTSVCVDNEVYAVQNFTTIDTGLTFTEDCSTLLGDIVYVPDANFKAALLEHLELDSNGDGEIQVSEASYYVFPIDIRSRNIVDLTGIEAFTEMTDLDASFNSVSDLTLDGFSSLISLYCNYNSVPLVVNVTNNTNLVDLSITHSNVTSLELTGNSSLTMLDCSYNNLTVLDIATLPIVMLTCGNNDFTNLDFSENTDLDLVNFSNCPDLQYVNLKNLNAEFLFVSGYNCPRLRIVCVDDIDNSIYNFLYDFNDNVVFSNNCDFGTNTTGRSSQNTGILYNTISGVVNYDTDLNGCSTADDDFSNRVVSAFNAATNSESITLTNALGEYDLFVGEGTFIVSLDENLPTQHMTATSETKSFVGFGNEENADLCSESQVTINDVKFSITPVYDMVFDQDETYVIQLSNTSSITLNGVFSVDFDSDQQNFISADPIESSVVNNTISWEIVNLQAGESRSVNVIINTPVQQVTLADNSIVTVKRIENIYLNNIAFETQTLSVQNEEELDAQLSIYPNPTSNNLYFKKDSDLIISSYKLFSITGQLLLDKYEDVDVINLASFSNGVYLLNIQTNKGEIYKRIIRD